jgi:ubiquinone/menaquinone biosynthesis C-methylase UbiE
MIDLAEANPTGRFTGLAEIYAQCRPDYPAAALDFIVQRCDLRPGDGVVDVGAGTGIFSRLLAQRGLAMTGIEPNAEMRAQAEAAASSLLPTVAHGEPGAGRAPEYRTGTGEETGLPAGFAQAVVCAQAFHWLKADLALAEFHRILMPGGWTALVWNERDESDPFTGAYGQVIRGFPGASALEAARHRAGQALLEHPLFQAGTVSPFPHLQEMTAEQMIGRAFSASYAPQETGLRELKTAELQAVFGRFAETGRVVMRYTTSVYTARRL